MPVMVVVVSGFVAAAASGAFLRFFVGTQLSASAGTFIVNLVGSTAMGFLFVVLEKSEPQWRTIVLVAFLGSLTTYSSFVFDCLRYAQNSQWKMLTIYLCATHALCFLGCAVGWQLAKRWVV